MGLIATVWRKYRQPARQVEAPNSAFNAPAVKYEGPPPSWDQLDLAALHEVNREAVSEVLRKARTWGPSSLSEAEQEFLIRMTAAATANRAAED